MSLTAKELYDRYQASKAGHRSIGDPPLPELKNESHEVKVGWDAVAWLASNSKGEAPVVQHNSSPEGAKTVVVNPPVQKEKVEHGDPVVHQVKK